MSLSDGAEFFRPFPPSQHWAKHNTMRPEGAVTVGLEWAHAKFLSQSASLVIAVSSLIALRRIATCSDLAEKAQGIRLVAAFLVLLGERQGALSGAIALRPDGQPADAPLPWRGERVSQTVFVWPTYVASPA